MPPACFRAIFVVREYLALGGVRQMIGDGRSDRRRNGAEATAGRRLAPGQKQHSNE